MMFPVEHNYYPPLVGKRCNAVFLGLHLGSKRLNFSINPQKLFYQTFSNRSDGPRQYSSSKLPSVNLTPQISSLLPNIVLPYFTLHYIYYVCLFGFRFFVIISTFTPIFFIEISFVHPPPRQARVSSSKDTNTCSITYRSSRGAGGGAEMSGLMVLGGPY